MCVRQTPVPETFPPSAEEDALVSLSCEAVRECIDKCTKGIHSVIVGSALGALPVTCGVLKRINSSPDTVDNVFLKIMFTGVAEEIAGMFRINGPVLTVSDSQNTLSNAITTVSLLNKNDFPAIVCIVDEHAPIVDTLYPHFSSRCRKYLNNDWHTTATVFIIDREDIPEHAAIKAYGPFPVNRQKPEYFFRKFLHEYHPEFSGEFLFEETNQSFVRAAQLIHTGLQRTIRHCIAGFYSPTSGAASLVEIKQR
jgi:hypothetical protein